MGDHIPDRGDLIWLDFNPQAGREQAGFRPALVLTPREYNRKTGLAVLCPITSHVKGYPFEVPLPPKLPLQGVVLVDHLKNLDWRQRRAEFKGKVPDAMLEEVLAKVAALLGIE